MSPSGVYVAIPQDDAGLTDKSLSSPASPSQYPHRARWPRARWALLAIPALLLVGIPYHLLANTDLFTPFATLVTPELSPSGLAQVHIAHLSSHLDAPFDEVDGERSYILGTHHGVDGDYPEDYTWVDSGSRKPFEKVVRRNGLTNSAIGRMPRDSPYEALVLGRGWNNEYMEEREGKRVMNLSVVGFFANWDTATSTWIRAGPLPYVLDIPIHRQYPEPCNGNGNAGPADPRFMWSDLGEPLAILGTSSAVEGVCKAVGIVDLRAVWPDLNILLDGLGYGGVPIAHDRFTELGKAHRKDQYHKNWAAFFPGPSPVPALATRYGGPAKEKRYPHFASRVWPRAILEIDPALPTAERTSEPYAMGRKMEVADPQCLQAALPGWNMQALHQATPFHRITMCARGTCEPNEANTVLMGVVHYKRDWTRYSRVFVTMKTTAPFEIISVSPPTHFGSVAHDNDVVFAVSMAFFPNAETPEWVSDHEDEAEDEGSARAATDADLGRRAPKSPFAPNYEGPSGWLSHGWLDDRLVIGAGLRDEAYDAIHLDVATALRGHTICREVLPAEEPEDEVLENGQ